LTPPGVAALAVLAVRGPQAWSIAHSLFQPRSKATKLPDEPAAGQFWLGRFGADVADDAVLAVKQASPAPWVEIHCHGGREIVRSLLESLAARGAKTCTWQQLEKLTGDDPLRTSALAALAAARTARTAAILLDQAHGGFGRAVTAILADAEAGRTGEAAAKLADLHRFAAVGRHLTTPWRVTVAGAPNVGKSSLVNAIAGYQRCIVAPTPGTTRDVVTTQVAIDGWPVELADTAGQRSDAEALEAVGIMLARDTAAAADLCLWVLDASVPPVWPEPPLDSVELVVNKIDLPPAWDFAEAKDAIRGSALTGAGIAELCQAIAEWLVPEPPPAGCAVPFTHELCDCVEQTIDLFRAGRFAEGSSCLRFAAGYRET
jgi:tRNA modification GTPase